MDPMVPLAGLWMPVVLAAVVVFAMSSLLHMVFTYHNKDYRGLQREAETLAALRQAGVSPGLYVFPYCASHKEMGSPEAQKRYAEGPVGMLTVMPNGTPAMGKFLGLWFVYCLLVSFFIAYLASRFLPAGTHYLSVFRFAGTTAFLAYGLANIPESIWRGQPWSNTLRALADGLVYSLMTAGVFGWLWPR
jgi:hypothetical protein